MMNLNHLIDQIIRDNMHFTDKYETEFSKDKDQISVTCLTCADADIQDQIYSKNAFNKIFTVRNIGNQAKSNISSLDYGINQLKTPILLILGHTDCSSIHSYLNDKEISNSELQNLKSVLHDEGCNINEFVTDNINYQVAYCLERYKEYVSKGDLMIIGAIYDSNRVFSPIQGSMLICNFNGISGKEELEELGLFNTIINDNLFI